MQERAERPREEIIAITQLVIINGINRLDLTKAKKTKHNSKGIIGAPSA